ncbi:MAG: hypothetical protein RMK29_07990 [Myxococcales bacterium]|nr:hypothetical protein [Myxococcota bacterium]MDW8281635.1 hypothetical protein [Myxococcales bacterium]
MPWFKPRAAGRSRLAGDGPPAAPGRFSLAAVLVLAALLEIGLYRILRPLLRSELDLVPGWLLRATELSGALALNLTSVLGLMLLAGVVLQLARPGLLPHIVARLSLGLVGGVHVLLALGLLAAPGWMSALGLSVTRAHVILQASFVCLGVLLALGVLPMRAQARLKVGMVLLIAPALCHFYTYWGVVRGTLSAHQMSVLGLGQAIHGAAAALALVCFCPWPLRQGVALAGTLSALVLLGGALLCLMDSEMLARTAHAAFGIRLPPARLPQVLYLVCLGSFLFASLILVLQGDWLRLRGLGLVLWGLSGYEVQDPHRMALLLLGVAAVLRTAGQEWPRASSSSSR